MAVPRARARTRPGVTARGVSSGWDERPGARRCGSILAMSRSARPVFWRRRAIDLLLVASSGCSRARHAR
ncbi:hypothetical protein CU254_06495 [Amycolatopsis sp. AA4]|nr:hypothetical protein CU254_06495 [Amycolatopsis sp. AA4]